MFIVIAVGSIQLSYLYSNMNVMGVVLFLAYKFNIRYFAMFVECFAQRLYC